MPLLFEVKKNIYNVHKHNVHKHNVYYPFLKVKDIQMDKTDLLGYWVIPFCPHEVKILRWL